MAVALTHIALHVNDIDACVRFYQDYAGLAVVHDRDGNGKRVVWLAEPGLEHRFILVFIAGGPCRVQPANDFSHLGFALASKQSVDAIAARADAAGCLQWAPRQEAYPVGYYCGIQDPNGNVVEFSYGQPLGAGAELEGPVGS